jgi:WD40 repeat protein
MLRCCRLSFPVVLLLFLLALPELGAQPPRTDVSDALPPGALARYGSSRLRHGTRILNSVLSLDGKLLATASGSSVIVWDLATGRRLHHFRGGDGPTFCCPGLALAPDGLHVGYVRGSGFACVWNLQTGKEALRFEGESHSSCCCFTPDGKQFALINEGKVRFWDVASRKEVHALPVEHVLLSRDGRFYASADERKEFLLGDTRTGKVVLRLQVAAAHDGLENGVALSLDGKLLALVDRVNKSIQVRNLPGGEMRRSFPLPKSAWPGESRYGEYRLAFSTDGKVLFLGTGGGFAHRWDLAAGKELPALETRCNVTAVHNLPDGRLVTTGADSLVRFWDAQTGRERSEPDRYVGWTKGVLSPDGRFAALGDGRGRLDLWDVAGGKVVRTLVRAGPAVRGLAFTNDGKNLAITLDSGTVQRYPVHSSGPAKTYPLDGKPDLSFVHAMNFSPDDRRLLLIDADHWGHMYDVPEGKLRWRGRAASAAFSPDGATVALAPGGPHLAFLDAATGKERSRVGLEVRRGDDNLNAVTSIAFAPDGSLVAVGLFDGHVALHACRSGAQVKRFRAVDDITGVPWRARREGPGYRVETLAFSADGKWLVTGGTDRAVRVWEVVTGKEVLRRDGHEGSVSSVAFGAGGRTVFSCSGEALAYLWDLRPAPASTARPSPEALWMDLLADDGAQAYRAIWALAEDPVAAGRLLSAKVRPVPAPDRDRLVKLIAELDSKAFRVRDAALKALREVGETATPALEEALARQPSLEVRRRLQQLLDGLRQPPTGNAIRLSRAVQALELAGTPEARAVLRVWADGARGARLTEDARAALERLRK